MHSQEIKIKTFWEWRGSQVAQNFKNWGGGGGGGGVMGKNNFSKNDLERLVYVSDTLDLN